jgi:hypothetical protein
MPQKGKGCDIGYALAACSCEGANSVEACTVTALDAITAFAVPNPNCPPQSQSRPLQYSSDKARCDQALSAGQICSFWSWAHFFRHHFRLPLL